MISLLQRITILAFGWLVANGVGFEVKVVTEV